jgi:pimeloyl-ACP methyl ester carboxylesterase
MLGDIKNKQGETLDYTFHTGKKESDTIVVLGHGVTGNKDRQFLVSLAEELAKAGLNTIRFSFSGNGASGGCFVESNITKEVEDLGAVLDNLPNARIGYIGHSMGGAVGVLRAARDPRIKILVSLAGMVNTKAFAEREFGMVRPGEGFMWDDSNCPLSQAFMDDLAKINSVADEAPNIKVPWLLIHGAEDDVVPISDSREIFAKANQPKELYEIPGANHIFTGPATTQMIDKVKAWIASLK